MISDFMGQLASLKIKARRRDTASPAKLIQIICQEIPHNSPYNLKLFMFLFVYGLKKTDMNSTGILYINLNIGHTQASCSTAPLFLLG